MMHRKGVFKYPADIRPVAAVSAAFALSLVPFVVQAPAWVWAVYWLPLMYVRSFCPYAQHNHAHLPAFNSPWLNRLYDALLAQTTGYQTSLWELHHNRGHHRHFLTPELDVARVVNLKTGRVVSRPWYALKGNLTIHRDAIRIGRAERAANKKSLLGKLTSEIVLQVAITAALLAWNPWMALFFFVIPCALTSWAIWWESYPHHLEAPTETIYDASVTIMNRFFNATTFNIGHHTAHHEKPTLHWSLLPARTEAIRDRIPEQLVRTRRALRASPPSAALSSAIEPQRVPVSFAAPLQ